MKTIIIKDKVVKHLTYEEWKQEYKDFVAQVEADDEECPECNGTGEVKCFHCGSSVECEKCEGTGEVKCFHCGSSVEFEKCEGTGFLGKDVKEIYLKQYQTDISRLTRWLS